MTKLVKQISNSFIKINAFVKDTGVALILKALECLCKSLFLLSSSPPLPQTMWIVEKGA